MKGIISLIRKYTFLIYFSSWGGKKKRKKGKKRADSVGGQVEGVEVQLESEKGMKKIMIT